MGDPVVIAEGLSRLAGSLDGLPLVGPKGGIFPATVPGKEASRFCLENGLVRPLPPTKEKNARERFLLSAKGREWLLEQARPRSLLERFLTAFQDRAGDLNDLKDQLRRHEDSLEDLALCVRGALQNLLKDRKPDPEKPLPGEAEILVELRAWQDGGALGDMPLAELFHRLQDQVSGVTVGQFHDACRKLRERGRIHLHPWTGPLFELPEPTLALLVGHEVAYYASLQGHSETGSAISSAPARTIQCSRTLQGATGAG